MWRDLRRVVIQFYMDLFASLERDGMDIHNPYHMMALQHLFMPRIQQEIDQFRLNWNAHPMRTRHNRSPNQLLMLYSDITAPSCDYVGIDDVVDENLIDNGEVDVNHVIVNPIVCPLSPNQLECFLNHIQPLTLITPMMTLKDDYTRCLTAMLNIAEMNL